MLYSVKGRETIASLVASVGFTAAQIPPAKSSVIYAIAQPVGGDIRICIDGTTPEATIGMKMVENTTFEVWGAAPLIDFRCIDDGGTATLEVVYMGQGG